MLAVMDFVDLLAKSWFCAGYVGGNIAFIEN